MIDLQSVQRVASAALLLDTRPTDLVVLHRPPVPTGLMAQGDGGQVRLSWTSGTEAGIATGYRVEAGSAPGLANLAVFDGGPATSVTVDGVPPGTYYVRVRATSWGGASAPSGEIVVTVP